MNEPESDTYAAEKAAEAAAEDYSGMKDMTDEELSATVLLLDGETNGEV